jgi:hypothetical protein
LISPIPLPLVCSVGICCTFEHPRVFVEIIPRQLIDVVTKTFEQVSVTGRPINDAFGCESIHDAIICAKGVGLALLGQVIPENLFFFFGETVKALDQAFFEFNAAHKIPYNSGNFYAPIYSDEGERSYESNAEPLAIILCKLIDTEGLGSLLGYKEKSSTKYTDCYQISWSELQRLDNLFNTWHV